MKTPAVLFLGLVLVSASACHTVKSVGSAMWPFGGKKDSESRMGASTGDSESNQAARTGPPSRQAVPASGSSANSNTVIGSQPYSAPPQRPSVPNSPNSAGTGGAAPTRAFTPADYLAVMTPGEVAVLQERARASGKTSFELSEFLTEKEKASLEERAALRSASAR
jgi:hypothetical protein